MSDAIAVSTRERILAAAKAEFARYGAAGARINRIASEAQTSKDRLYAHFAGKEELYRAVTEQWCAQAAQDAAMTAEDIPGYVGQLYDHFLKNPDNARLQAWAELESLDNDLARETLQRYAAGKVAELRRGQRDGMIDEVWPPMGLMIMLTDVARTAALHTRQTSARGAKRAENRRLAILAATRLVTPQR